MTWQVQSRGGLWCVAKDQAQEPDAGSSVPTLCEHFVIGPCGIRRAKYPTCVDCRAVERTVPSNGERQETK